MERKSFYENIEWEMLKFPLDVKVTEYPKIEFKSFYKLLDNEINIQTITFERNEKYDIIGKFKGMISIDEKDKLEQFNHTNFNKIFTIESEYDNITFKYERTILVERIGQNYTITFYVTDLKREVNSPEKTSWISEWYLNGPHIRFSRFTEYVKNEEYTKKRLIGMSPIIEQNFNFPENVMSTLRNYLYILPKNCPNFIISKIPSEFDPKWPNKISIEYYGEFGFPDDNSKQIIVEILSLIFGRHLIKIGESGFDENGHYTFEKSVSPDIPYLIDIKHVCNDYDYLPIDYTNSQKDKYQIEKDIALLIDEYINSDIDYHNVFNYLRNSILLPPESEIVLLGGALDYLITQLRKKYNINDEYLSEREFIELIGNELTKINEKLSDYPKLLNNLNTSYKKKGTSNFDEVFNELDLEIGEIEDNAIRYRHIPAHGQKMKQKTKDKFPILVAVYRTLLNRCILKSLNYNNDYFDAVSQCNRPLNEPIPPENFDKLIKDITK